MKTGDIVYFKEGRAVLGKKTSQVRFLGHGVAVFLGVLPPQDTRGLNTPQVKAILATIGLMTLDDVAEFIGFDAATTCVKKFEEKYSNLVGSSVPEKPAEEPPADPSAEPPIPEGVVTETPEPVRQLPVKPRTDQKGGGDIPGGGGPLPL